MYGLGVHTTLSLDSAARICLANKAPARRLTAADFPQLGAQFQRCAREFYVLESGGERLAVRSLSLQLSPEDDLEMRVVYERPSKSPLSFDTSKLTGLPPSAGIVLTVTGRRSFLGQRVLRTGDARFECSITPQGEAIETLPAAPEPPGERIPGRLLVALIVLAVVALGAFIAWRRRPISHLRG